MAERTNRIRVARPFVNSIDKQKTCRSTIQQPSNIFQCQIVIQLFKKPPQQIAEGRFFFNVCSRNPEHWMILLYRQLCELGKKGRFASSSRTHNREDLCIGLFLQVSFEESLC